MKAIITIGAPASGKSTFAKENYPDYVQIERDKFREMLRGSRKNFHDWDSSVKEEIVQSMHHRLMRSCIEHGLPIIISDTHISRKTRYRITKELVRDGYEVTYAIFDTPLEELKQRNNNHPSDDYVPEEVLEMFYNRLGHGIDSIVLDANRLGVKPRRCHE